MTQLRRWLIWLSRIHRCGGFGIQSPTDYWFVRYVVNEQWPYYAYDTLAGDDWLTQKLGRLYFRLANWRQPEVMLTGRWNRFCHAACLRTRFVSQSDTVELAFVDVADTEGYERLLALCDERSVVVVESPWRDWNRWHAIECDARVGTTFDLYYCAIVLFDKRNFYHHYQVNF